MPRPSPVLVVALDGFGSHPSSWHLERPRDALDPARLVRLARRAEAAGFDAVALDDSFDPAPPGEGDPPWRWDALLAAAHIAAATSTIGVLATVTVTHTEPFHVSKNVATLDLVSQGRAAWRLRTSTSAAAAARFGRRGVEPDAVLAEEAADVVEVVRRLWDSWEDDAVIRDRSTGRYIDRRKLHTVDFDGRWFNVRGPSITPRPPQGQPLVAIDAERGLDDLAAATADLVIVTAGSVAELAEQRAAVRHRAAELGRDPDELHVLAAVGVGEPGQRHRLDDLAGPPPPGPLDLVAPAAEVAATIAGWVDGDVADGVLLQPDATVATLDWLTDDVLPQLPGSTTPVPAGTTFRDRLGLRRPANRYAVEVGP